MINSKIQYFENVEKPKHQEFILAHNNCVLCGTILELQYVRLEDNKSVKEEATCPNCEIKTRAKIYTLI